MFITLTECKDKYHIKTSGDYTIIINTDHIRLIEPYCKGGSVVLLDPTVDIRVEEPPDEIINRINRAGGI